MVLLDARQCTVENIVSTRQWKRTALTHGFSAHTEASMKVTSTIFLAITSLMMMPWGTGAAKVFYSGINNEQSSVGTPWRPVAWQCQVSNASCQFLVNYHPIAARRKQRRGKIQDVETYNLAFPTSHDLHLILDKQPFFLRPRP